MNRWSVALSWFLCAGYPLLLGAAAAAAQQPTLDGLNSGLQAVTQKTLPCVVRIAGETLVSESDDDDDTSNATADQGHALGSGIVVSPDGYIVTNAHVISGLRRIRVFLNEGNQPEEKTARIVGVDRRDDLAVLKVMGADMQFMDLAHIGTPGQGEIALAFGSPFGLEHTVTMGIISDVGRQTDADDPRLWVQTDAAVNPGNSGGPLVDSHGSLLGINTLIYSDHSGGGNEGVALAIPGSVVADVYHQIVTTGKVTRSTFGISPLPLTPAIASALTLAARSGILVQNVTDDSPADKAGVQPGDVLATVNSKPTNTLVDYTAALNSLEPGVPATVQLWHGQQMKSFTIKPIVDDDDMLPLGMQVHVPHNLIRRLEILAVTLKPSEAKLIGDTIYPHGVIIAARSSTLRISRDTLQAEDVIYSVNGKPVDSLDSLRTALEAVPHGAPLVLQIERDHALLYVPLEGARQ